MNFHDNNTLLIACSAAQSTCTVIVLMLISLSLSSEVTLSNVYHLSLHAAAQLSVWCPYTLLFHMWRDMFTPSGLYWMQRLHFFMVIFFILFYFIIPIDILPESALGILGLLDDLLLLVMAVVYVTIVYRAYVTGRIDWMTEHLAITYHDHSLQSDFILYNIISIVQQYISIYSKRALIWCARD